MPGTEINQESKGFNTIMEYDQSILRNYLQNNIGMSGFN